MERIDVFRSAFINDQGIEDVRLFVTDDGTPSTIVSVNVRDMVLFSSEFYIVEDEVYYKDEKICTVNDLKGTFGDELVGYIIFNQDSLGRWVVSKKVTYDGNVIAVEPQGVGDLTAITY